MDIPSRGRCIARRLCLAGLALCFAAPASAQVCNLRIVTDASPDFSDMEGLVHSATSRWETPAEKCWALFYWTHIGRRQTSPMVLHGLELTDPIRQFSDYGYTMCSTVAGMNCAIWDAMGLDVRLWDITLHTVSEVRYDSRWHVYDNSMSALYTLCDSRTIAAVEDVGRRGACPASEGREEAGHIARYHCLNATSSNGFLTGADCSRDLAQEHNCFRPDGLKHRWYYNNWDRGHRHILNLRQGEAYTRHYSSLGTAPEYYVPNAGKDPESVNPRYRIRGNGLREFRPRLTADRLPLVAHWLSGVQSASPEGVQPTEAGRSGEVVFKVEGSNVICAMTIRGRFFRADAADEASIALSTTNGLRWKEVWRAEETGEVPADLKLVEEVNGSYEVLVRVRLLAKGASTDSQLRRIEFETITMLNSKTLPRLNVGKNIAHVGAGDPTESIVLWPDLQGESYRQYAVEEENIASRPDHPGYMGVIHAAKGGAPAQVTFRIDSPRDIRRVQYGGRLYNRAPKSHIDFLHSFDGGRTWTRSYSLTRTEPPWDVIHYEAVTGIPPGTRSVLFRYVLESPQAGSDACSIYALRMEANHAPADPSLRPVEVTFRWSEVQEDHSLVERSHCEVVTSLPHEYAINVGGADHPVMGSLRVAALDDSSQAKAGYSDGRDDGGEKFVHRWVTYGRNLAKSRPYTVSRPSRDNWGAGDPGAKKLTDGVVGPPYAGGTTPSFCAAWAEGDDPVVTLDLGSVQACGAFRIHMSGGWPWWDALKGEVKDRVEVETSSDGAGWAPRGAFDTRLRWKDIPANLLMPDDETAMGPIFELIPPQPVEARYVRFAIRPARILVVSEVEVLDGIRSEPFDFRIALPGRGSSPERGPAPPAE